MTTEEKRQALVRLINELNSEYPEWLASYRDSLLASSDYLINSLYDMCINPQTKKDHGYPSDAIYLKRCLDWS